MSATREFVAVRARVPNAYNPCAVYLIDAEDLKEWAEAHRLDTFQERKSLDLVHATIGFRTGMPRLALRRGIKWALVLEMLKVRLGGRFVRIKSEIDKDALLAERDTLGKEKLASLGVEVVQDESFYVEPKREDAPAIAGAR